MDLSLNKKVPPQYENFERVFPLPRQELRVVQVSVKSILYGSFRHGRY